MSLSIDGVWKVLTWATTVWANGVWRENSDPRKTITLSAEDRTIELKAENKTITL